MSEFIHIGRSGWVKTSEITRIVWSGNSETKQRLIIQLAGNPENDYYVDEEYAASVFALCNAKKQLALVESERSLSGLWETSVSPDGSISRTPADVGHIRAAGWAIGMVMPSEAKPEPVAEAELRTRLDQYQTLIDTQQGVIVEQRERLATITEQLKIALEAANNES